MGPTKLPCEAASALANRSPARQSTFGLGARGAKAPAGFKLVGRRPQAPASSLASVLLNRSNLIDFVGGGHQLHPIWRPRDGQSVVVVAGPPRVRCCLPPMKQEDLRNGRRQLGPVGSLTARPPDAQSYKDNHSTTTTTTHKGILFARARWRQTNSVSLSPARSHWLTRALTRLLTGQPTS